LLKINKLGVLSGKSANKSGLARARRAFLSCNGVIGLEGMGATLALSVIRSKSPGAGRYEEMKGGRVRCTIA
jgi:hypothetical protein